MPKFAANIAYLFTERPLIERFAAAAAAGFKAVELQFPYDHAPSAVKAELEKHSLTQLGLNSPPGREGEFGVAALPGRERDWDASFQQALDYAVAIGGSAVHCLAGKVPPEQRPAAERTFIANLSASTGRSPRKRRNRAGMIVCFTLHDRVHTIQMMPIRSPTAGPMIWKKGCRVAALHDRRIRRLAQRRQVLIGKIGHPLHRQHHYHLLYSYRHLHRPLQLSDMILYNRC